MKAGKWRTKHVLDEQKYPKTHLKWKLGEKKSTGFIPPIFDYGSSEFHQLVIETFMKQMKEYGFGKNDVMLILSSRLKMKPMLFNKMIEGTRPVGIWELPLILELAGMSISIKKKKDRFIYHSEGINNEQLVISCRLPKFTAVFNKNDLYDFDVYFDEDDHICHCVTDSVIKRRGLVYFRFFKQLLDWYFLKRRGKKKYPFSFDKMKVLFLEKFYNNKTRHAHSNSIPKESQPAKYETDNEETEKEADNKDNDNIIEFDTDEWD